MNGLAIFPHRPLARLRLPASEFEVRVVQDTVPPPDRPAPQQAACQYPIGQHRSRFLDAGGDPRVESGAIRQQASFAARGEGEGEGADDVPTQDRRDRRLRHGQLLSSATTHTPYECASHRQ